MWQTKKLIQCVVSSQEIMLVMLLLLLCFTIIDVLVLNNVKTRRWKYFEEKTRVLARADS